MIVLYSDLNINKYSILIMYLLNSKIDNIKKLTMTSDIYIKKQLISYNKIYDTNILGILGNEYKNELDIIFSRYYIHFIENTQITTPKQEIITNTTILNTINAKEHVKNKLDEYHKNDKSNYHTTDYEPLISNFSSK